MKRKSHKGYRPKAVDREEVKELRRQLSTLTRNDWQKAQYIMQEITAILKIDGPCGSIVSPRSCSHCEYYGHTKQFCPLRKAANEAYQAAVAAQSSDSEDELTEWQKRTRWWWRWGGRRVGGRNVLRNDENAEAQTATV